MPKLTKAHAIAFLLPEMLYIALKPILRQIWPQLRRKHSKVRIYATTRRIKPNAVVGRCKVGGQAKALIEQASEMLLIVSDLLGAIIPKNIISLRHCQQRHHPQQG